MGDGVFSEKGHEGHKEKYDYYPAARRGYFTDGVSPVESRSITPQGGVVVALPFGRPRDSKPRGRYNLIAKFFVYFVVDKYYNISMESTAA